MVKPWLGPKDNEWSDPTPTTIHEAADVSEDLIEKALDCAEAAYGLGNDFRIDWERAYGMLEMYGWDLAEMDSPADRKIRREVNKRRRLVGLGIESTEPA